MTKAELKKKRTFSPQNYIQFKENLMRYYLWNTNFYGSNNWEFRKLDWKYLENFESVVLEKDGKINWNDHVENKDVLHRGKEERHSINKIKWRKANLDWSHLAWELPSKRGCWRKDKRFEKTKKNTLTAAGCSSGNEKRCWNLKLKAADLTRRRVLLGRVYVPVTWQPTH